MDSFIDTEYKTLLKHSKTLLCLTRMNVIYEILRSYFRFFDTPQSLLKNVFNNLVRDLIDTFQEYQSEMFHATITSIEGEKVTVEHKAMKVLV